jgi:hypothetical protein
VKKPFNGAYRWLARSGAKQQYFETRLEAEEWLLEQVEPNECGEVFELRSSLEMTVRRRWMKA